MRVGFLPWAWLLALLSNAIDVRADSSDLPAVTLTLIDCPDIPAVEVRRIATIELKVPTRPMAAEGTSATAISIRCEAEAAILSLSDPLTEKSVQRSIDLRMTPALARPRLLALSVAELVSASWAELELSREESSPKAPAPAELKARAIVRARQARVFSGNVEALVGLRLWSSSWLAYGPRLRLTLQHSPAANWGLLLSSELAYERGTRTYDAGIVSLALYDAALVALVEAPADTMRFAGGAGLRGGLLRAGGEPHDPSRVAGHQVRDGYWGPMLELRASWLPSSVLCASLSIEAGWTARAVNVRVLNEPRAGAGHGWLAFALGLGTRF